jgi:hypothetical protein
MICSTVNTCTRKVGYINFDVIFLLNFFVYVVMYYIVWIPTLLITRHFTDIK